MTEIAGRLKEGVEIALMGDSITKNMERFGQSYLQYFPASTVVNASIAGDTVDAILYRAEVMNFPSFVTAVTLFCGTNNLFFNIPHSIVATIIEILFVLRKKCPNAIIYLFPILPRFDCLQSQVPSTNSLLSFQIQDLFTHSVVFHELPSSLFNRNLYRKDKVHLNDKGNEILVKWFHHLLTASAQNICKPNTEVLIVSELANLNISIPVIIRHHFSSWQVP